MLLAHDRIPAIISTCGLVLACGFAAAAGEPADPRTDSPQKRDIARQRLEIMTARMKSFSIAANESEFPKQMQPEPLFRYDDETRGYVDGTVWRLGEEGRPLAIITAELHPKYLGGGPRVVYDFLSLTTRPFTARSIDVPGWSPSGSAVDFKSLPNGPTPADEPAKRLAQLKQQARRFRGTQDVKELDRTLVNLRLLPKEIDRYSPAAKERADGAIYFFVNGRNPAVILFIETDGESWQYGIGRLSAPSNLEMRLDDVAVWSQPRIDSFDWSMPYTASNVTAKFP